MGQAQRLRRLLARLRRARTPQRLRPVVARAILRTQSPVRSCHFRSAAVPDQAGRWPTLESWVYVQCLAYSLRQVAQAWYSWLMRSLSYGEGNLEAVQLFQELRGFVLCGAGSGLESPRALDAYQMPISHRQRTRRVNE